MGRTRVRALNFKHRTSLRCNANKGISRTMPVSGYAVQSSHPMTLCSFKLRASVSRGRPPLVPTGNHSMTRLTQDLDGKVVAHETNFQHRRRHVLDQLCMLQSSPGLGPSKVRSNRRRSTTNFSSSLLINGPMPSPKTRHWCDNGLEQFHAQCDRLVRACHTNPCRGPERTGCCRQMEIYVRALAPDKQGRHLSHV